MENLQFLGKSVALRDEVAQMCCVCDMGLKLHRFESALHDI